jgi:hypothetical protein
MLLVIITEKIFFLLLRFDVLSRMVDELEKL